MRWPRASCPRLVTSRPGLASEGPLPSRQDVRVLVEELLEVLFPESHRLGTDGGSLQDHVAATIGSLEAHLETAIFLGLHRLCGGKQRPLDRCAKRARLVTGKLLEALPDIRAELAKDVLAAYESDPAASGIDEIVACYPGLYAIAIYRVAHRLIAFGAQVVPRMLTEYAHSRTGIDIHPGADDRRVVLHRPRHRHRHRRDLPYRKPGAHLSRGDAGRAVGPRPRQRRRAGRQATSRRSRTRSRFTRTPRSWAAPPSSAAARWWAATPGSPTRCLPGFASGSAPEPRRGRSRIGRRGSSARCRRRSWTRSGPSGCCACSPGPRRSSGRSSHGDGRELPRPEYQIPPEVADAGVRFRELKSRLTGDNAIEVFLRDTCDAFATAARMLGAAGTRDFYHHSVELYGRPGQPHRGSADDQPGPGPAFRRVVDGVAGRAPIPSPQDELIYTAEEVVPLLAQRFARLLPGPVDPRRAGRRHRRQGGRGRRRRSHQARRAVLASGTWPSSRSTRGRCTWRPR